MISSYSQRIIKLVAVGLLVVAVEIIAVWWLAARLTVRTQDIKKKQTILADTERARFNAAIMGSEYERMREFIPRIDAAFVTAEQLFGVLAEIKNLAQRTGNRQTLAVEGQSLRPAGFGAISFVPFSAEVGGSYLTLRAYLKELRKAPFFMQVDSVDISAESSIIGESRIVLTGKIFLK